jgi:hypothetical protein
MSDLTCVGVDGIPRSLDEHYDTLSDVEQDPCGAHKAIQDQAARIKELEAQLAWQPIETAPKTGISVLLWDEDSSECTVGWYRINHKDDSWRSEYDLDIDATHWMPLPNMPKENNTNE